MDVSRPHTALSPALDGEVLLVLARTNRPLTGREVARLTDRKSHAGVLDVLSRLSEHGLVDRQEAGRALLYSLNREHLAAPAVTVLASMRTALVNRLRDLITSWELEPCQATMFGSAARGDGDMKSDIDLFIVRAAAIDDNDPGWREQLSVLATRVRRWTGNNVAIVEIVESEVLRLSEEAPLIVADLVVDSILLYGPPITEWLSGAA